MSEERWFLESILKRGDDFDYHAWRKIYADWLDEDGQSQKAAFLRSDDFNEWQRLAADLDPMWLAAVSNPKIENCGRHDPEEQERSESWWRWASRPYGADNHRTHPEATLEEWQRNHPDFRFDFICHKKWQEMTPTADPTVRHCEECKKNVYYCDNIMDVRDHASNGHCVGVDLGVIRREDDTSGDIAFFGRPGKDTLKKEEERRKPDAVSAKRLAAKGVRTFLWMFDNHRGRRAYLASDTVPDQWQRNIWDELRASHVGDGLEELQEHGIVRKVMAPEDIIHPEDMDVKVYPDQSMTIREWFAK